MSRNHKIFLGIGIFLLIVYICLKLVLQYQTTKTIDTLYSLLSEENARLTIVPEERVLETSNPASLTQGVLDGTTFTIPFTPTNTQTNDQSIVYTADASGKSVMIITAQQIFDSKFETLYGFTSDHDAYTKILSTTLQEIDSPKNSVTERSQLLTLGLLKVPLIEPNTKLYTFSTTTIKGFQFGEPSAQTIISLEIFDQSSGKHRHTIIVDKLTQEEIDSILHSLN